MTPNIHTIIRDHVSLSSTCLDRLYINGYVPTLQTSGQLCYFLREHLGNPIPSPALFKRMGERFRFGYRPKAAHPERSRLALYGGHRQ